MRKLCLLLTLALFGCEYSDGEGAPATSSCGEIREALIDTGAELEIDPGAGVGVFVEYLGEGEWHVRTTCDTAASGNTCYWDLVITALDGGELFDFTSEDFDPNDSVGYEAEGSLRAVVITGQDVDGLRFQATPGGRIRFDAYLDGYCAHPYVFWAGDGAVHTGAPGNPVEFLPSE